MVTAANHGWVYQPVHVCDFSPLWHREGTRFLQANLEPKWIVEHLPFAPPHLSTKDLNELASAILATEYICKLYGKQRCHHCKHFFVDLSEWTACPVCREDPNPGKTTQQQTLVIRGDTGSSAYAQRQGPFALGREGSRAEEARRDRMRELLSPVARD
ncbi:hypothetical protein T439DRAFT_356311 [Meredithblackwellia eburnea MCA 4105]